MDAMELHGELLRPEEVRVILGIGRTKLYSMIRAGELPALRIGRLVRVPRRHLEAWMSQRLDGPPAA
ncbi:MAG: helix-turn-helix domain-containing protein [Acidimicrobiaceae bacterium]|nr:helix-turn-helix domain-containing protein [Acidimicrobiaceae bacterium]